jgi:hypothetical protein
LNLTTVVEVNNSRQAWHDNPHCHVYNLVLLNLYRNIDMRTKRVCHQPIASFIYFWCLINFYQLIVKHIFHKKKFDKASQITQKFSLRNNFCLLKI